MRTTIGMEAALLQSARLCLVAFLAPAVISKIRDTRGFIRGLAGYRVVPERVVRPVGVLVITAEIVITTGLIVGFLVPLAAIGAAALFLCYLAGIGINLRRGSSIPCNCHVIGGNKTIGPGVAARNVVLSALGGAAVILAALIARQYHHSLYWQAGIMTPLDLAVPVLLVAAWAVALVYLAEWLAEIMSKASASVTRLTS
jgi:uncharacterized membrane protein YphA (DoxX/SURF4 family)